MSADRPSVMGYTDERMIPELSGGECFWQHVYRYQFAAGFVRGKAVLDIACGEGYGSFALGKAGAANVAGVDISEEACRHAREKYGIIAHVGSAEQIPMADASVDVVVSFETIEHVKTPGDFLKECRRVLKPGGVLVISTPDKLFYDPAGGANPHHCSEMTEQEFAGLLKSHFGKVEFFAQTALCPAWNSLPALSAENSAWTKIPGFSSLRRLCLPQLAPAREKYYRQHPEEVVLSRPGFFDSLFNPHLVRRADSGRPNTSMMMIAVCHQ